ncbi:hypothetical protein GALMADRAFT_144650 [Galerina marginata CBS 339.88]|uniref:Uncharacterized protein n=1 Tax=Galerina marginata (strain CBS 339.88) TaxID=685588 RepID=A0A067SHC1_GALM3|nr:hypothetical protein GALMADRAFT_144650 [Galerina marginata CBS 339.88]
MGTAICSAGVAQKNRDTPVLPTPFTPRTGGTGELEKRGTRVQTFRGAISGPPIFSSPLGNAFHTTAHLGHLPHVSGSSGSFDLGLPAAARATRHQGPVGGYEVDGQRDVVIRCPQDVRRGAVAATQSVHETRARDRAGPGETALERAEKERGHAGLAKPCRLLPLSPLSRKVKLEVSERSGGGELRLRDGKRGQAACGVDEEL